MDWSASIDAYCERSDPSFWAEPINAVTNLAFVLAGLWAWRRTAGLGRVLSVVLMAIGVGSFLFHTVAEAWSGLVDVLPIVAFIMIYIYGANRSFWGMGVLPALGLTAVFLPYAAALGYGFSQLPFFRISAAYWSVPLLIAVYAALLRTRAPEVATGLALGSGLLVASLVARSLDETLCAVLPMGTHFLWHILNAIMLAWMIEVWQRAQDRSPSLGKPSGPR